MNLFCHEFAISDLILCSIQMRMCGTAYHSTCTRWIRQIYARPSGPTFICGARNVHKGKANNLQVQYGKVSVYLRKRKSFNFWQMYSWILRDLMGAFYTHVKREKRCCTKTGTSGPIILIWPKKYSLRCPKSNAVGTQTSTPKTPVNTGWSSLAPRLTQIFSPFLGPRFLPKS